MCNDDAAILNGMLKQWRSIVLCSLLAELIFKWKIKRIFGRRQELQIITLRQSNSVFSLAMRGSSIDMISKREQEMAAIDGASEN